MKKWLFHREFLPRLLSWTGLAAVLLGLFMLSMFMMGPFAIILWGTIFIGVISAAAAGVA